MFICISCGMQHSEGVICSTCKGRYDFPCSGITETGYRKLGDRKNHWRCPKCKTNQSPSAGGSASRPDQLDSMQEQLTKIVSQLAPLASLLDDVKLIKGELSNLKDSLEMAHGLIANFTDKVMTLENRIKQVEESVNEVPVLRHQVERLNRELLERDQRSRANNVEIRGIPSKNNENLYEIAEKISKVCGFPYKKEDINYIARIPTRVPNSEKPIIMAFNSRYIKEDLVALARKRRLNLSDLGHSKEGNFYVNDHLTPSNKILLSKARTLAKEKNFQHIWVKHCKIMARKSDTSPIFFIKTEADLQRII